MKTLYITDLDGTLLKDDLTINLEKAKKINKLIKSGDLLFSVCTARSISTIDAMINPLGVQLPVGLMNGIMQYDPINKKILGSTEIGADITKELIFKIREYGLDPEFYTTDGRKVISNCLERTQTVDTEYKNSTNEYLGHNFTDYDHLDTNGCIFVSYSGDKGTLQTVYDELISKDERVSSSFFINVKTNEYLLEFYNKDINKGTYAKALAKQVGADYIVAFGDNANDIPMLQAADKAIVTSNALDSAKAVADEVIASNNEDAVFDYIINDLEL